MSRVWMITGANRGLGRAFAEQAVAKGDLVVAAVRKIVGEDTFLTDNDQVLPVLMDVTDKDAVNKAVEMAYARFRRIDVLINNAGFGLTGAFEEVSDEEIRRLMETDYFGVVNVTKAVLPIMREQRSGMILNVSSMAGVMGFASSSIYCSAKHAVVGLAAALNQELGSFGIRSAAVCPGAFRTDFRDASSMMFAGKMMEAYDDSAAHSHREFLLQNNHKQEGNPEKAAELIYKLVDSGTLPERIMLGKACCEGYRDYLKKQLKELESYMDDAVKTDFEKH